jgi:hypothetical protein
MRKKMFALMLWAKTKTAVIITCAIVLAGCGNSIAVRAPGNQRRRARANRPAGTWVGQRLAGRKGSVAERHGQFHQFQGLAESGMRPRSYGRR